MPSVFLELNLDLWLANGQLLVIYLLLVDGESHDRSLGDVCQCSLESSSGMALFCTHPELPILSLSLSLHAHRPPSL